jgi:hypothetical protein
MLADMSSLTALAHASHITSQASYTTFFATVATIIPVLFIATALQGSTAYQALLKANNFPENGNIYPAMMALAILISGGGGELVAVYALYDQSIDAATAGWILAATIILTLAAAAGPAVAFWKVMGGGRPGGRGLLDPIPPEAKTPSPDDVLGGKVAALASRAVERDYIDVAAALARGYSVAQLTGLAVALDPGLTAEDFADTG